MSVRVTRLSENEAGLSCSWKWGRFPPSIQSRKPRRRTTDKERTAVLWIKGSRRAMEMLLRVSILSRDGDVTGTYSVHLMNTEEY